MNEARKSQAPLAPAVSTPATLVAASIAVSENDAQSVVRLREARDNLKLEIAKAVVGQDTVIDSLLVALLCRGHALMIGVPGLGKTLAAREVWLDVRIDALGRGTALALFDWRIRKGDAGSVGAQGTTGPAGPQGWPPAVSQGGGPFYSGCHSIGTSS